MAKIKSLVGKTITAIEKSELTYNSSSYTAPHKFAGMVNIPASYEAVTEVLKITCSDGTVVYLAGNTSNSDFYIQFETLDMSGEDGRLKDDEDGEIKFIKPFKKI